MDASGLIYPTGEGLQLPDDLAPEMFKVTMDRVARAIADSEQRNDDIEALNDQLEGRSSPVVQTRWKNACDLEDPLTAEHFYDVLSNVIPGWQRAEQCIVDPIGEVPVEDARTLERWINQRAAIAGIRDALYSMFYYANSGLYSVVRVMWKNEVLRRRTLRYLNETDGSVVEQGDMNTVDTYKAVEGTEVLPMYSGVRFTVPHPTDFYMYPANSKDIPSALIAFERMPMLKEDLIRGIDEIGLDRDAVMECISKPDAETQLDDPNEDRVLGSSDDPPYECEYLIGSLPILMDGEDLKTPEDLINQDWEMVICRGRNAVLMCRPYRYPVRPWALMNAIVKPDSYLGTGTVQLLETLQEEATATMRAYFDSVNIAAVPALIATQRNTLMFGNQSTYPGAVVLVEHDVREVQPMQWDMRGLAQMEAVWSNLYGRAAALSSAQGRPSMGAGKVRKAAEVDAMQDQVVAKFELIFNCVQRAVVKIFEIMQGMYAVEVPPEGDIVRVEGGDPVTVTPDMLARQYQFTATTTTDSANPERRAERSARKNAIQNEYLTAVTQLPPEYHNVKWNACKVMLMDEGERQPEQWLGPEPPSFEDALASSIAAQAMGDPNGLDESGGESGVAGGPTTAPASPNAKRGQQSGVQQGSNAG